MPFAIGAAVKDRRRDQRATTTGRRLVYGKESPLSPAGSLNRMFSIRPAQMVLPILEYFFWKGRHPGLKSPTSRMASPRTASGRSRERNSFGGVQWL